MRPLRQGDVLLIPTQEITQEIIQAEALPHLILAQGEVTGHKHQIVNEKAELYQVHSTVYLRVFSQTALLMHEEHNAIHVPQGTWEIKIQRDYEPGGWRYVTD
ncbi:hypothetical protein H6G76_34780 [Nostoc sp. FACHB-152]|uniref:hypothetical protein n=1 Tax=Nostoc sp. FACHB-152 TaxID=2692837 RepID=UPI0016827208|nr:hypothetical protein [Nostoc sp. FACHB-152]MBD2452181.1 hypothetical protein [Nostoc sp. FACHB-152]